MDPAGLRSGHHGEDPAVGGVPGGGVRLDDEGLEKPFVRGIRHPFEDR
jgi:hypothetical protein